MDVNVHHSGATIRPVASTIRAAVAAPIPPTLAILPSRIATSVTLRGVFVPSINVPPLIIRSYQCPCPSALLLVDLVDQMLTIVIAMLGQVASSRVATSSSSTTSLARAIPSARIRRPLLRLRRIPWTLGRDPLGWRSGS